MALNNSQPYHFTFGSDHFFCKTANINQSHDYHNDVTVSVAGDHEIPEDATIDDVIYDAINVVVNCFLINFLAIFGTCGNVITLVVLARHGVRKDTANILLTSLTFFDLMFCLTIPFRGMKCVVSHFNPAYGVTTETLSVVYVFVFNRSMTNGEIWLVAAISVERFFAVWFPFQVARIFTPTRVKYIVLGIILLTLAVMSPALFTFTYEWVYDPELNATVALLLLSDFYQDNYDAVNFMCYVVYNIVLNGLPWLIVVFCGISTGIKVVRIGNLRKRLVHTEDKIGKIVNTSKQSHKEKIVLDLKVIKMLMLVCLFAGVVFVPTMLLDVYSYYVPNFLYQSKLYSALVVCIDLLYTLNASGNFLIYASVSNKFSRTYQDIFRQCGFKQGPRAVVNS